MSTIDFLTRFPRQLEGAHYIPLDPGTKKPPRGYVYKDTCAGGDKSECAGSCELIEPGGRIAHGEIVGVLAASDESVVLDRDLYKGTDTLRELIESTGHTIDDLPPTFVLRSQNGGLHHRYRQNPLCLLKTKHIGALDVVASPNMYTAFSDLYTVVDDSDVEVIPLWLAELIVRTRSTVNRTAGTGTGAASNGGPHYSTEPTLMVEGSGRSAYLVSWKGRWCNEGLSEDEANERCRDKNKELGVPLSDYELESRVLAHKDWDWGMVSAELTSSPGEWTGDPIEDMPDWARGDDSAVTCGKRVATTYIEGLQPGGVSDSYTILAPEPPIMTPKEIRRKAKAEGHHLDFKVPKVARDRSAQCWRWAPAGCFGFYDWLMFLFESESSPEEVKKWISTQPRATEYLAWLVRSGLIQQHKEIWYPLPDKRGKCVHLEKDCREHRNKCCPCASYPGWIPEYGDCGDRPSGHTLLPEWDGDEAREILLDLNTKDIENRVQRTHRAYAALMNLPKSRGENGFVSKAMITRWMKELRGYRRERIPGTKQFMWVYDITLAKVHITEPGYAYRRNHTWANHPDTLALGPEPEWVWESAGFTSEICLT